MEWQFGVALLAGLVLASLADWIFAGLLFHDRYQAYPEVWRFKGANAKALALAQALTIPTVAGLVWLLQLSGRVQMIPALTTAALVWVIAAAPAIIANGIYIKLHPYVVASHTIGWLVKLLLVAGAASLVVTYRR